MGKNCTILFFLIIFLSSCTVYHKSVDVLKNKTVFYYNTLDKSLPISKVLSQDVQKEFKEYSRPILQFPIGYDYHWIKFEISGTELDSTTQWLLECKPIGYLSTMDLYVVNSQNHIIDSLSLYNVASQKLPYESIKSVLPLNIPHNNSTYTVYLRVFMNYRGIQATLNFWKLHDFLQYQNLSFGYSCFILGIVLVVVVLSFVMFFAFKSLKYLFYSLYVLSVTLWIYTDSAFVYDLFNFSPQNAYKCSFDIPLLGLAVMFCLLFVKEFVCKYVPNSILLNKIVWIHAVLVFLVIFIQWNISYKNVTEGYNSLALWQQYFYFIMYASLTTAMLVLLYAIFVGVKAKLSNAYYVLLSTSPLVLFGLVSILNSLDFFSFSFKINSYFIEFLLFEFIVLSVALGLEYKKLVTLKKEKELNSKVLELKVKDAEIHALKAKIEPHFVFNALNNLQGLILANQPYDAINYLQKFAVLTRETSKLADKKFITIHDEVEFLQKFLSMETMRYKNRFEFKINVDKNIDTEEVKIPSLLLQPVLAILIKYGILTLSKEEIGLLKIHIALENDTVLVRIQDNGTNLESRSLAMYKSETMVSVRERLKLLNEEFETDKFGIRVKEIENRQHETTCSFLNNL